MITVRIVFKDGSEDIRDVLDLGDICLDGVDTIKIIRDERRTARAA